MQIGQRIIGTGDALTDDEVIYLEKQGVTLPELWTLLGVTNARMALDAAIGGVKNLKTAFQEGKTPADPRGLGIADIDEGGMEDE